MEDYSDSDTSSESECESDKESAHESNCNTDEGDENLELEPEISETVHNEYVNAVWDP